ncbi:hypothetical protein RJ639_014149 [Escallonia herrerae]|uniref:Apyrase n=1 Tax=Escallonia herrerae TaxID=1293975 RepID=A0AA89AP37_9ASTE|nr:hypothetical protein RJ639_014149 [Escallonia herrerae]
MPTTTSPFDSFSISSHKLSPDFVIAKTYAIIFDAGSSGSRVHVFCFDRNLDLVPIGGDLKLFLQIKPGLSTYDNDPKAAVNSLLSLLEKGETVVPRELCPKTPVRVGVRDFLKDKSALKSKAEWVTVLDRAQEELLLNPEALGYQDRSKGL